LAAQAEEVLGKRDRARARLQEMARIRLTTLPGVVTPDVIVPEANLLLRIGDTLSAVRALESTLAAIRYSSPLAPDQPTNNVARIASLVRSAALRAELAGTADSVFARTWATAVATLWTTADSDLQPTVARMKAFVK